MQSVERFTIVFKTKRFGSILSNKHFGMNFYSTAVSWSFSYLSFSVSSLQLKLKARLIGQLSLQIYLPIFRLNKTSLHQGLEKQSENRINGNSI